MAAYRKEKFAVKTEAITPEPFAESELALHLTTNGTQWQTVSLTRDEALKVVASLTRFLDETDLRI